MCSRTKVALWSLALAGLALAAVAYFYARSLALFGGCGNDILAEAVSPDGAYVAAVFERNCGATTPYYHVVSLRLRADRFDPEKQSAWVFEVRDRPTVRVSWTGNRQLSIVRNSAREATLQLQSWEDVRISYR